MSSHPDTSRDGSAKSGSTCPWLRAQKNFHKPFSDCSNALTPDRASSRSANQRWSECAGRRFSETKVGSAMRSMAKTGSNVT